MTNTVYPGEFALIESYFKNKTQLRSDTILGIGDDAALLHVPPQQLLVAAIDTIVSGVHFLPETSPYDIAYKALAVNLSDLAAMGAEPAWLTLALTLPQSDSAWLQQFSDGLFALANQYHMQLVGGDTTRGPLTVTIQAHGFVPPQQALLRSGAQAGDKIYVSGILGDAALGLKILTENIIVTDDARTYLLQRHHRPSPRVELGLSLRNIASSAIDISDGLLADLQHILDTSGVGATVDVDKLPLSNALREHLSKDDAKKMALTGGDDYELCFTVPSQHEAALLVQLNQQSVPCTCIGVINQQPGILLDNFAGKIEYAGFKHF